MKTRSQNLAVSIILMLSVFAFFPACKKSGGGDLPNANKFPLTNFNVSLTNQRVTETSVYITYDVKNASTQNYVLNNYAAHLVYIKFTITTTDGTTYQESRMIPDLESNRTTTNTALITISSGKTLDPSKTKYELYYER